MSYYQSSDNVMTYDPSGRYITILDNIHVGMRVRFSHPDYSYNNEKSIENLSLNEVYTVSEYMIYTDGVNLTLEKFPELQFDSKLFTIPSNNFISPYGRRRTRFFIEKLKLSISKLCKYK